MCSSSPVCHVRLLSLFKHLTEQNTDDGINHTEPRGLTVIPMQISCPIDAGPRISTGTECKHNRSHDRAAELRSQSSDGLDCLAVV